MLSYLLSFQGDDVRLHEAGWKDRYYALKFKGKATSQEVAREYLIGLSWVLKYYYQVGSYSLLHVVCL